MFCGLPRDSIKKRFYLHAWVCKATLYVWAEIQLWLVLKGGVLLLYLKDKNVVLILFDMGAFHF